MYYQLFACLPDSVTHPVQDPDTEYFAITDGVPSHRRIGGLDTLPALVRKALRLGLDALPYITDMSLQAVWVHPDIAPVAVTEARRLAGPAPATRKPRQKLAKRFPGTFTPCDARNALHAL